MRRLLLLTLLLLLVATAARAASVELLNASYDPTRELWRALNAAFVPIWKARTGQDLAVRMSHGGSAARPGRWSTGSRPTSSRWRWSRTPTRSPGRA